MTIYPNFITLKHALEAKKMRLVSNQEIVRNTRVDPRTIGKFIRADISLLYFTTLMKFIHYFKSEGLVIEVGDFFCWKGEELVSNIGSLIARLDPIPTDGEVHDETGIPFLRVENLVRGNVKRIYLDDLAALLVFFRKRGLSIDLGDLLREEEADSPPF